MPKKLPLFSIGTPVNLWVMHIGIPAIICTFPGKYEGRCTAPLFYIYVFRANFSCLSGDFFSFVGVESELEL